MTEPSQEALRLVRDPSHFSWNAVTLLGLAIYVYSVEIERRNWSTVLAGLAFWCVDWFNEVVNALILHFTGYAPLWATTGSSSLQIFVGLNLEICLMFSFAGIVFAKTLPKDPKMRILGIPNRVVMVLGYSIFCVIVELFLHATGSFHWAYSFWNERHVELIVLFGYATFYAAAAWVHDMADLRSKLRAVAALAGVPLSGIVVFGFILRWI